ncbi:hypothetical protein ACWGDT_32045 [Streptomyces avermitilis]
MSRPTHDDGPEGSAAHETYVAGVRRFAARLTTADDDGLARPSTVAGALVLARAVKNDPLSDDRLDVVRRQLLP